MLNYVIHSRILIFLITFIVLLILHDACGAKFACTFQLFFHFLTIDILLLHIKYIIELWSVGEIICIRLLDRLIFIRKSSLPPLQN